jgi:5-epi-alpha-selinene synthase
MCRHSSPHQPLECIELAPEIKTRNDVKALARLAGRIICWTNDLLSYDKERAHGDVHNLLMLYEHHRKIAPDAAVAEAIQFINGAMQEFLTRAAMLPPLGAPHDTELRRYLQVLGSVMRVTLAWTFESTRYSEPVRESGFIPSKVERVRLA